jgi:hypothetical protein
VNTTTDFWIPRKAENYLICCAAALSRTILPLLVNRKALLGSVLHLRNCSTAISEMRYCRYTVTVLLLVSLAFLLFFPFVSSLIFSTILFCFKIYVYFFS